MYFGMERKKQKRKNATPILRPGSFVGTNWWYAFQQEARKIRITHNVLFARFCSFLFFPLSLSFFLFFLLHSLLRYIFSQKTLIRSVQW